MSESRPTGDVAVDDQDPTARSASSERWLPGPLWLLLIASFGLLTVLALSIVVPYQRQASAAALLESRGAIVKWSDGSPEVLREYVSLEWLRYFGFVNSVSAGSQSFGTTGAAAVGKLSRVERLQLSETEFSDACLVALEDLERLSSLDLSSNPITGPGLTSLQPLTLLRRLELNRCPLAAGSLPAFDALVNLEIIELNRTDIGDADVAILSRVPKLSIVSLRDTAITDASIPLLGAMPHLDWIDLTGSQVSEAGIAQLIALRPECSVRWEGGAYL